MQTETAAIAQMTQSFSVLEKMSVTSLLPGSEKRAEKNLIKTLRDHVTYPVELIKEMNAYGAAFLQGLRDYDDRIVYNWDGYDDDEKKELFRLINEESGGVLGHGLQTDRIEFADFEDDPEKPGEELLGEWRSSELTGGNPVIVLSNKLLRRPVADGVGVLVHEQGHGLVTKFAEQARDVVQGKSGLMWSRYGDNARFYMNPEEALVRAFEVNVVECLVPDSAAAGRIRKITVDDPGYGHMASAKQFFSLCQ